MDWLGLTEREARELVASQDIRVAFEYLHNRRQGAADTEVVVRARTDADTVILTLTPFIMRS